ncbi:hypothetical protein LG315_08345 [Microbacterium marinum]|uniref:hypothetical protein n=1 Tax=Microbacterium marinum TaxID=421115 RepID=UPI00384BC617
MSLLMITGEHDGHSASEWDVLGSARGVGESAQASFGTLAGAIPAPDGETYTARTEDDKPLTFLTKTDARAWLAGVHTKIARREWEAPSQLPRWTSIVHACGLPSELAEEAIASDAFGALAAGIRRAEALGHNDETLLSRIVAARGFDDAQDVAGVLHERLERVLAQPSSGSSRGRGHRLIAGLIPTAMGEMDAEMRRALDERAHLIEERASALVDSAVASGERWITSLGPIPVDTARVGAWRHQARIVAAYRDRYGVFEDDALGAPATSPNQRMDAAAAAVARDRAIWLSRADAPAQPHRAPSRTRAVHSL